MGYMTCCRLIFCLGLLLFFLMGALSLPTLAADTILLLPPPRPQVVEAARFPHTARILRQIALSYTAGLARQEREQDFLQKLAQAKNLLNLSRLVDLRFQTLALAAAHGKEPSWEFFRDQRWPQGERVGLTLSVPVWVPSKARRVVTYAGFEKRWQTVATLLPRPSGYVWFAGQLQDINDKAHYRVESIQFEINSRFAPLAALFLEYIFREGWYERDRRVPLLVVRGGEDTFAASAYSGPVTAECLSFTDEEGASIAAQVVSRTYPSLAAIHHGRHSKTSNHRLGLALDLNDFNFAGVIDGPPNPISRATRQYDRDAMHRLDARHLPAWVYRAAKWVGLRLPQEWIYFGYHTDWAHFDVGTK